MPQYYHAHKVDRDKCKGHMTCMRQCPTQAIRVRNGKAEISSELCVDCGTCITVCKSDAIISINDPVNEVGHFKYKVVVPSPVLYSQFDATVHPYIIHLAFKELGFDAVVDVGASAEALARALIEYMKEYKGPLPLISSHCPSIIRLIQVKYPDLVDQVVPLDVPREITAREIKKDYSEKMGIDESEIGVTYVAPCPARIVSINQPAEKMRSYFDNVVSIKDVFSVLMPHVVTIKENFDKSSVPEEFSFTGGWATLGSITRAARMENWLAVSGIHHVMQILDDIENSRLRNIDFVEVLAHMLGCISGPYNVESPYVARANGIKRVQKHLSRAKLDPKDIKAKLKKGYYFFENPVLPRPTTYFDTDLETSIKRMKERERVFNGLRQIDCGCCGSPTCLAFADDFVRGQVKLTDCIYLAKQTEE